MNEKKNALEMPKRQHYLKFQCSIPAEGRGAAARREKVVAAAQVHLYALAGPGARNLEIRAVYQDRGTEIVKWWDILVVAGFDGTLTPEAREKQIERVQFEFEKTDREFDSAAPVSLLGPDGQALKN